MMLRRYLFELTMSALLLCGAVTLSLLLNV